MTRKLTRCALFAAMMALCAWIGLPLGNTVFTMQTFGVLLALGLLGGKRGTISILCYLLLGAVGLPVFSGFRGGIGAILGPTGGYLWGFLATGLAYWALEKWNRLLGMIAGLALCYGCGTIWYMHYTGGALAAVLAQTVLPYLIPDALKLVLALRLTKRLKKISTAL